MNPGGRYGKQRSQSLPNQVNDFNNANADKTATAVNVSQSLPNQVNDFNDDRTPVLISVDNSRNPFQTRSTTSIWIYPWVS